MPQLEPRARRTQFARCGRYGAVPRRVRLGTCPIGTCPTRKHLSRSGRKPSDLRHFRTTPNPVLCLIMMGGAGNQPVPCIGAAALPRDHEVHTA